MNNSKGNSRNNKRGPGKPVDKEFTTATLDVRRVARVVAGGRRFSFRTTVVVGDKKGRVGVGVAKGKDASASVEKATREAKKYLINVPIVNGTIPYQVHAKYKASFVILKPTRGRGIVAGGPVRAVCELAGIKNVSGKLISRTTNKLTNAQAVIQAFRILAARYNRDAARNKK